MEITIAKSAGFCFGVKRAVDLAMENKGIYCLGDVIHNKHAIADLEKQGVLKADTISEIKENSKVLIRAHGVGEAVYEELKLKNCSILDATCPFVLKIHEIVKNFSGRVVIFGKNNHPEVEGILGWCKNGICIESLEELNELIYNQKLGDESFAVVAQTTLNKEIFKKYIEIIKKECTNAKIFDTICSATDERQTEARHLAKVNDLMVVIGDRKSSNTKRLYEISKSICENTILVEDAEEIKSYDFDTSKIRSVAITAGASTPARIIKEVKNTMGTKFETGDNFAELLEQSFKTLNTGDKVTATVVQVNPTEIQVDLGVKQAGFIRASEMSDDPNYRLEDNVKAGDEIEVIVIRVNDVEGYIDLSKRRVDQTRGWEVASRACEDKEVVEGIVIEENKGGIVATYNSVRVFIPASQTGLGKETPMSTLLKQTVKFRITEVNRAKRRVVGSIRSVLSEARKEAADKIWAEIAVGSTYTGTVKSITAYGAFVDIGGVDGMVHISELSWNRVKHPSELVKVGQEIEVFVISLDAEKRKISLGHKKANENPWLIFTTNHSEGDVVPVKILKFMPFGAFAEIVSGVDGLIHISQISEKRIAKAEEALEIGQVVDAKIIEIDAEKQKVSLSVREANGVSEEEVAEEAAE